MQEHMIIHYCDHCLLTRGVRVSETVHPYPVTVGTQQAELDLCDQGADLLLAPLTELLAAIGRRAIITTPPEEDQEGEARTQCPLCSKWMSARNRQKHANKSHGIEAGQIVWRYGPEVEYVWPCSCGMTFHHPHGRSRHASYFDHETGPADKTIEPPRPI